MPPIKTCMSKGKRGSKYGTSGKCYTGKGSRKKAAKQGVAVRLNRAKRGS